MLRFDKLSGEHNNKKYIFFGSVSVSYRFIFMSDLLTKCSLYLVIMSNTKLVFGLVKPFLCTYVTKPLTHFVYYSFMGLKGCS